MRVRSDFIVANQQMAVSQARLAKEVLAEIPDQFLSYMRANSIKPGSWRRESSSSHRTQLAPSVAPPFQQPMYSNATAPMYPSIAEPPPAYSPR